MSGSRFIGDLAHVATTNVLDGPALGTLTISDIAFYFFELMFAATATTSRIENFLQPVHFPFSCHRRCWRTGPCVAIDLLRFCLVHIGLLFRGLLDLVSEWLG